MFKDPLHWFPSLAFSNLLALLVIGSYLVDYIVPKITASKTASRPALSQDRSSFLIIQGAGVLAIVAAVVCRYFNWTVLPGWAQWLGLAVGFIGITFREWAVITLGSYFSRVVEIEEGHRIITTGPYHWIRHPAYTGMILVYVGLGLAIGSGAGALISSLFVICATIYRINIEETVLSTAFGDQFDEYARRRWRLFPGW
jgi:protein-S-isoprenylcysteine O-methyltransferase Ste14